jgi:hypothetical protein
MYLGQAEQDKFTLNILKEKKNGTFLEIGCGDAVYHNNTYLLEKNYNWRGIMIDSDASYSDGYQLRPNSIFYINNASSFDYVTIFKDNNIPSNIDFLSIDLDVTNASTINVLDLLDNTVFDNYKFAVIAFEHDIWQGDHYNTRQRSRDIFSKRGYICVFQDVNNEPSSYPFEDWYVHPDLVDMDYVNTLIDMNKSNYMTESICGVSIFNKNIKYPGDDSITSVESPVIESPAVESPAVESPAVESPAVESPAVESPAVESPVVESPVVESPAVESPSVESLAVESPAVESPSVESLAVESPVVESPVVESPAVESPSVESPVVESPAVESPSVESLAVESPAVESLAVESPAVESPAVESPAVESPAVDA